MPKLYPTVLFDLDGTLLDTIGMIVESMRHSVQHHMGYTPTDDQLVAGVGTPLIGQVRAHAVRHGGAPDDGTIAAMAATYVAHNRAIHDARVTAYPGVADALEALRLRDTRLAIVTSKPVYIARRGLEICGLSEFFEVLIGSDSVTEHKPHPEPVFAALRALDLTTDGVVFVGDSPHDMHAGRAAGVSTAAALWGPFSRADLDCSQPSYWLDSTHQLSSIGSSNAR